MNSNIASLSESELITLSSKGDSDAFGALYEKYVEKIYSYLYYKTSSQPQAEDLTSQVFLKALRNIETYEDRGYPFSAWLYRIAHNLVVNWYRDKDKIEQTPLEDGYPLPAKRDHVEEHLQRSEEEEALLKVIGELSDDRQQLVILKFVEGLTNQEIGEIMNRTEGAIKALYHRTLSSLRDEYGV